MRDDIRMWLPWMMVGVVAFVVIAILVTAPKDEPIQERQPTSHTVPSVVRECVTIDGVLFCEVP